MYCKVTPRRVHIACIVQNLSDLMETKLQTLHALTQHHNTYHVYSTRITVTQSPEYAGFLKPTVRGL